MRGQVEAEQPQEGGGGDEDGGAEEGAEGAEGEEGGAGETVGRGIGGRRGRGRRGFVEKGGCRIRHLVCRPSLGERFLRVEKVGIN